MDRKKYFLLVLLVAVTVVGVVYFLLFSPKKPVEWTREKVLHLVPAPEISDAADVESLVRAIDYSLTYFDRIEKETGTECPQSTMVSFGKEQVPAVHIKESLLDFKAQLKRYGLTREFFQYVSQNYRFYQSAAQEEVLFTGYFEADLKGSLAPSEVYRYPLYRRPGDLYRVDLSSFSLQGIIKYKGLPRTLRGRLSADNRTIVPYYTREEIDCRQKLAGNDLEIVWIDDPIDVFFLHIQGSGMVTLDNGETLRVNYDESNGHPYYAIGRYLVQQEILTLENVSMQSIREYLEKHPEKMEEIFITNPSYVFFRVVDDGPMGAIGVPVTAFRSIATDGYLFPKGALCYVETQLPVFDNRDRITGWQAYSGFVLNQDTGGAICGPGRVDLFTGYGKKSKLIAGHLKQYGTFYFLIKK
ncbi:MAG: murein transglycosylase A [Candidatus Aminicenantes bacterium]|jgi:membrane-bound lytic murein transglycosylase A